LTVSARNRAILGLIVVTYVALATLDATRVPIWNAPDEPAHFNYVKSIAVDHALPILQPGDYDQALLEQLTHDKFPPDQSVATLRYESHQPPLYYVLAAPALALTQSRSIRTQVIALRLVTIAIGALFILACFRLARLVFPGSSALPLAAAAFVAFIPMHLFMSAAVDNDALAELMLGLTLIVAIEALQAKGDSRDDVRAGVIAGLAILTKLVAAVSIVLVALGFLGAALLAPNRARALRQLPVRLVRAGMVTLVLSGWWVARNLIVYGWRDPFGLRRHAVVVVGQPPTGLLNPTLARQMLLTLFHSFWGQFGWMGIPFADRTYDVIAAGSALVFLGMILFCWRMILTGHDPHPNPLPEGEGTGPLAMRWKAPRLRGEVRAQSVDVVAPWRRWAFGLLGAEVALVVVGVVFYNLQYLQPQGRYLFPTLPALAIFAVAGVAEIIRERYVGLVLVLASLALVWLAVFSLFDVIGPGFAS
jgi:4-amino-4-deoxy-L-arabinose transferase-like glycosyltransferase